MNKKIKKGLLLHTTGLLLLSQAVPVLAAGHATPKEEVIYALLNETGRVNELYAVNILTPSNGKINDYGHYSEIRNMTTQDTLEQRGNEIIGETDAETLYYEGTLTDKELPWIVDITYTLDGVPHAPAELAGKDGHLHISLSVQENPNGDHTFFEEYALQATLLFDTEKVTDIKETGATSANVGKKKQLTYTILPGQEKDMEIDAEVTDFEMDAIAINGVKLSLDVNLDEADLYEKLSELQEGVSKIDDGATQVDGGVEDVTKAITGPVQHGTKELHAGSETLANGTKETSTGSASLHTGANELAYGSSTLNTGLLSLNQGIKKVQAGLDTLTAQSPTLTEGSTKVLDSLQMIQGSLEAVSVSSDSLTELTQASSAIQTGIQDLAKGVQSLQTSVSYASYQKVMTEHGLDPSDLIQKNKEATTELSAQIDALSDQIQALKGVEGMEDVVLEMQAQLGLLTELTTLLQANTGLAEGTRAYFAQIEKGAQAVTDSFGQLEKKYTEFDQAIHQLTSVLEGMLYNVSELKQGIDLLVTEYQNLDIGIDAYTRAVYDLSSGYQAITTGSADLVKGSAQLNAGSRELVHGSGQLTEALETVNKGAQSVSDGTGTLDTRMADLAFALTQLRDGTTRLSTGTAEMKSETDTMEEEIETQVDDLLSKISGEISETRSFVDSLNEEVSSVQFVLKTPAIEKEAEVIPNKKEKKQTSFFEKLLDLFRSSKA